MRWILLSAVITLACAPGWDVPSVQAVETSTSVDPFGSLEAAPEVLRLRIEGALGRSALQDFRLFEGELSPYHLGRVRARELPKTLLEREVPLVVWAEPPQIVAAPTEVLAPGRFSLATPELGLVASLTVVATETATLERLWPPAESGSGAGLSIFCGDAAALVPSGNAVLAPAGVSASIGPGLDEAGSFSEQCLRIEPERSELPLADGALLLPPLLGIGVAFEPLPLIARAASSGEPSCEPDQFPLGPACARLDDDRITIFGTEQASLWAIAEPTRVLGVAEPTASLVVRGLEPGTSARVVGSAFDSAGTAHAIDVSVSLAPRREHLVVNEVLADPAGPEASGEWVELVNDGTSELELADFEFRDSGGSVRLPAARLAPGAFALLVGPEFAPDPELDVLPVPGTRILALAALGKAGLSNGGELLRLTSGAGVVVARWPALAAPAPGQSLARRTPAASDSEAASFGAHAAPGASPGAANVLAAEEP